MRTLAIALVVIAAASSAPAGAEDGAAPAGGRYQIQPVEGGFARLDTETGEISICRIEAARMVCRMGEDERAALEARIKALENDVKAGKRRAAGLAPKSETEDEKIDRTLDRAILLFRTFRSIARDLDEAPSPAAPDANRT